MLTTTSLAKHLDESKKSDITDFQVKCLWFTDYRIYNLFPLTYNNIQPISSDDQLNFNICGNTETLCNNEQSRVVVRSGSECIRLSRDFKSNSRFELISDSKDDTKYDSGLKIMLPSGDAISPGSDVKYNTTLLLECDKEDKATSKFTFYSIEFTKGVKDVVLRGKTKSACPEEGVLKYVQYIFTFRFYTGPAIILIGLLFALFGLQLYKGTMLLVCVGTSTLIAFFFVLPLFPDHDVKVFWIVIGIGVLVGLLIGFLILNLQVLIFILLGGTLGFLLSDFALKIVAMFEVVNDWITYVTWGILVLLGMTLGYFLADLIIVIGTSFIGFYFIIFGASLLLNIPLTIIIEMSRNGEFDQIAQEFGWPFMVVLAVASLVFLVGLFYQISLKNKTAEVSRNEKYERIYVS